MWLCMQGIVVCVWSENVGMVICQSNVMSLLPSLGTFQIPSLRAFKMIFYNTCSCCFRLNPVASPCMRTQVQSNCSKKPLQGPPWTME